MTWREIREELDLLLDDDENLGFIDISTTLFLNMYKMKDEEGRLLGVASS